MRILITGGFGFVGINAALYFRSQGHTILLVDDASRGTVKTAMEQKFDFTLCNVDEFQGIDFIFANFKPDIILHFAAQTAVTTSIENPSFDFMTNVVGTFNILEAMRKYVPKAKLIYSSTNKVYGNTNSLIGEIYPLDFKTPYGCSKGAADQYVRDYAETYGLHTIVARMSCIYGEHQMGCEDQGWISHFIKKALRNEEITIYGDGEQVRDVLHVDDLMRFFYLALAGAEPGEVYNVGGGVKNAISVSRLITFLETKCGLIKLKHEAARINDPRKYVTNFNRAYGRLNWKPQIFWMEGIERLIEYENSILQSST